MLFTKKMEYTREQSPPKRTITTTKHLRSSVRKYFSRYKTVVKQKKKKLSVDFVEKGCYFTMTTNLQTHLEACHPSEAAVAPQTSLASPSLQQYLMLHSASAEPLP